MGVRGNLCGLLVQHFDPGGAAAFRPPEGEGEGEAVVNENAVREEFRATLNQQIVDGLALLIREQTPHSGGCKTAACASLP